MSRKNSSFTLSYLGIYQRKFSFRGWLAQKIGLHCNERLDFTYPNFLCSVGGSGLNHGEINSPKDLRQVFCSPCPGPGVESFSSSYWVWPWQYVAIGRVAALAGLKFG